MDNNEGPAHIDNKADRHAEKMAKKESCTQQNYGDQDKNRWLNNCTYWEG